MHKSLNAAIIDHRIARAYIVTQHKYVLSSWPHTKIMSIPFASIRHVSTMVMTVNALRASIVTRQPHEPTEVKYHRTHVMYKNSSFGH